MCSILIFVEIESKKKGENIFRNNAMYETIKIHELLNYALNCDKKCVHKYKQLQFILIAAYSWFKSIHR